MHNHLIIFILFIGLVSCVETEVGHRLGRVESLMSSSPDMAEGVLLTLKGEVGHMSCSEKALYSVLLAESHYRRSQVVDDSLLSAAGVYYLRIPRPYSLRGGTVYFLLHSIRMYGEGEYVGSLREFHRLRPSIERLSDPYLGGVLHYYLGRIYLRNRLYCDAVSSFRRERGYVLRTGDSDKIVKSDHHLALSFLSVGSLDSCRHYLLHSLRLLPDVDSCRRAMILHNVRFLWESFLGDRQLPGECLGECDEKMAAQRDSADLGEFAVGDVCPLSSSPSFSGDGETTEPCDVSRAPYYLTLYHYYRQCRDLPAALDYYELYHASKSRFLGSLRTLEISALAHGYSTARRYSTLWAVLRRSVILFLILILLLLSVFWQHAIRRYHRLYSLVLACRGRLTEQSFRLSCARREALARHRELESLRYRLSVSLGDRCRLEAHLFSYRDLVDRLFHRFMFRDGRVPIYGRDFVLLVEEYCSGSASGREFVHHLRSLGVRLSARDIFICILFHEQGGKSGDLSEVLGCSSPSSFKSAKSKIKSRLRPFVGLDPEVSALLEKFC